MIRIPVRLLDNKDSVKKLDSSSRDRIIMNDKIVNRRTEPTLFNVQAAAMAMQVNKGQVSIRTSRRRASQNNIQMIINDTFLEMNVSYSNTPKNFSLLECNVVDELEENPNIMDMKQTNNLQNSQVSVDKYFGSENDPILQLDEGNNSRQEYQANTINGVKKQDAD
ncbi:MAG: hypothetical protein VXZ62_00945 [Pseudomonadota bacterium]|nr:hypothetical protein [Pseudomonadota bacterium]